MIVAGTPHGFPAPLLLWNGTLVLTDVGWAGRRLPPLTLLRRPADERCAAARQAVMVSW
jgi:hypothetical protein